MVELLSPAGSAETLLAAVKNGADAVYLGLPQFSARAGAENFDDQALKEAMSLCAEADVKVYIALNTLLHDKELPQMRQALRKVASLGVDGIIVQDLATAALAREICPALPLHASTQMCIHSLEGAKELERLGFTRVVLARELTKQQVAHITQNTRLETEVFVHGALCMCYSGHCYFSAVVGRNSGNRGRCAQPCRLPYEQGYPLSLKDLSLVTRVDELIDAGVTSFKIEGRLKSAAYVAAATATLRKAMNGEAPSDTDLKQLEDLFSREGFTDGYWTDSTGPSMFGTKQKTEFADYKTALNTQLRRKPAKRFPLDVQLIAKTNEPTRWIFSDGERTVSFSGENAQPAQNKALDAPSLREKADKLQDTHYFLRHCDLDCAEDIFVPVSAINLARRQGVEQLDRLRREKRKSYPCYESTATLPPAVRRVGSTQVLYHSPDAFNPDAPHHLLSAVWLRPEDIHLYQGDNVGAHIDHFTPESSLPSIIGKLQRHHVQRVLVGNLGHLRPFAEAGFEIYGDYGFNIMNSVSLAEIGRLGVQNACLSFELSLPRVRDLQKSIPTTLIAYGRLPLMQFKNCVIRQKSHCIHHHGFEALTDRKGHTFLLQCRADCGNTLFNSLPLLLKREQLQGFECCDKRLDFTDESPRRAQQIIEKHLSGQFIEGEFTNGLYLRGVL